MADDIAGLPSRPRRWVTRSLRSIRRALRGRGFHPALGTIARLLRQQGLSPRRNRKHLTPRPHPDRDRQFRYIRRQRAQFARRGAPMVSVDCKAKELIGPFARAGTVWCPTPLEVYTSDFPDDADCKATPYGVYDVGARRGHLFVTACGESPELAVQALARWWRRERRLHPGARQLLVLADNGPGNSCQSRRWKYGLQCQLADAFGLTVVVCHYPVGASKWNPIEHEYFGPLSARWAGQPLTSLEQLVATARDLPPGPLRGTATHVRHVPPRRDIPNTVWTTIRLRARKVCPRWNYVIRPRSPPRK